MRKLLPFAIGWLILCGAWGLLNIGLPGYSDIIGGSVSDQVYTDSSGFQIFTDKQPPYRGNPNSKVSLLQNPAAVNPTWEQLQAFISEDGTDRNQYIPDVYVCAEFAEDVHNNAEAAGIKTAFVALKFDDGSEPHALNAFQTEDKGLVFIDCTGKNTTTVSLRRFSEAGGGESLDSYDKVAYICIGEQFGLVSLDVASSPTYSFYEYYSNREEEYSQKLEAYNREVKQFNQALGGRTYLKEPEYSHFMSWSLQIEDMKDELDRLQVGLGKSSWDTSKVVSSVEIFW